MRVTKCIRTAVPAAVALAALSVVNPAQAVNLLLNPSFEAPTAPPSVANDISGWTRVNDASRATFRALTGQWAIWAKTFQAIGGGFSQEVNIQAGQQYDFSANLNVEGGFLTITDPVGLDMRLTWLDSGGSPVGTESFLNITPASNPAIDTWIPLSINDVVAPAGAAKAKVFFGWTDGGPGMGSQSGFWDDVVLDGPGTAPSNSWAVDGSGNWNDSGNWTLGLVPNAVDATADFAGAITAARTVFTDTATTIGTLSMGNANTYVLAGAGTLTFDVGTGNAQVIVTQGLQKVNLPVVLNDNTTANVSGGATLNFADPVNLNGRTLNKTGAGTMLIEAPVSGGGSLRASAGNTQLNFGIGQAAVSGSPAVAGASVVVDGAAKVSVAADQTLSGLDADTAVTGDQEVDLLGNRARVYGGSLATAEQGIYDDIKAAYASGSGHDGIYSSLDDAGTNLSVGVTDQSNDANGNASALVRLTRTGDANVDGVTDIGDFAVLAANFNVAGRWDNGDFDYNGQIDIGDFSLLAANFNQSAAGLPRGAAVPEPALLSIGVVAMGLLARRRA
jgi:hypothetical protein